MSAGFQYDVFLSHNSRDKPRVRRLAERLKQAGLRVWFDDWIIKPGDDIYLAIERGLEAARVQVLCLSPAALGSDWVALERSTVLFRDPTNAGRRFVPLLLADCNLPDTLRRYQRVDYQEESDSSFKELLTVCQEPGIETPVISPLEAGGLATIEQLLESPPAKSFSRVRLERESGSSWPAKPTEPTEPFFVLERKLAEHEGYVCSLAVSPDCKWMASGSEDRTVRIWDLEFGKCVATLRGHTDCVRSVTVTRDGKRIISGARDGTVRVWETRAWRELAQLKGFGSLSLEGNARVLSGGRGVLGLWDLDSQRFVWANKCDPFSDDKTFGSLVNVTQNLALSGHQDGRIRLWCLQTGECQAILEGHRANVCSIAVTLDGRFAVSGSEDKTVKVWDLELCNCLGTFEGHGSSVESVAISPDTTLIASTGFADLSVRLWDWKSGACLQTIMLPRYALPISVAFSPNGSSLFVGTYRNSIVYSPSLIYAFRRTGTRPVSLPVATRRYVNAKVVLLGEGTVGKTSLAHRLIDDKYVVRDRTHGMNVWRLDLPLLPDAKLEREALLWDLAGQEDYRLIHQIFLEETALALLLVNPQKDDPFAEAGDWLKSLKTAANTQEGKRDAARLLVFSQIDVGGMKVGNLKIDRFREQYGFVNWLQTSAKTGENCSDVENAGQPSKLKQLIADSIPWDKLPWTSTPRLLAELKNAVVAMRDQTDIRLLRFAELAQRLEQALPGEKFGESDVRTAVTLLANHGLARPLKFGDLVLLRPDLLNGYAGAIIRAARAHTDEIGCVLEANIYDPKFDFTGVERLKHRPDEELLLRALVQTFLDHSLCIAEDTPKGRHLVFPSQYRREKDTPKNPDIFVSYTFGGEWQTVWTTLVVRLWYSQEFEHRELWRNAAEFASSKGHTLGLLVKKAGDGQATISAYFDVEVPDELKAMFIEYVHRHLARYACEVTRDRRYVCPECGKPVKDLEAVRRRFAAKKDFITCQDCDEQVPLIDFIEQRLKSDPVAQKILAMDATATRQLDTQALEQILIGHMMAIAGEANQIFRPVVMFDYGIDGEVEFKDNDGRASGKKIYVQLKSGNSYLRTRQGDGCEIFDVKNERHLEYWLSQPVDVYLVIRQTDEMMGGEIIRWMNVTRYLKARKDKKSRQIIFDGHKLDMEAVWKVRDIFFPPGR